MAKNVPYFYDRQTRRYIQQFIRLFSGFSVQMGVSDDTRLPIFQQVPVRYGDINRMAAHITRENSENIANTVPFISCYVQSMEMMPERRIHQQHVEKVQVAEKRFNEETNSYSNEIGNTYTVERYMPVPYKLTMNCDIWTSNTEQKLQLFEQIGVLFNPTLDIRTTDNAFDWSSLAYVEMTSMVWSSRQVGSTIDDIVDVMTMTFELPILINPPAKVKQQKIIHTVLNELYNFEQATEDLEDFEENKPFDTRTLQYTVITFEDRKMRFENNKMYLLSKTGSEIDPETGGVLQWESDLEKFGELREGISQIRMRKSSDPSDNSNDIVGRLSFDPNNPNALLVDIDEDTLPTATLYPILGVFDPTKNYPGDGSVPTPQMGDRYLITQDIPQGGPVWSGVTAQANDIIQYNGSNWFTAFDASASVAQQYVYNTTSQTQLEWNGSEWFNSYEGVYKAGYWRIYL